MSSVCSKPNILCTVLGSPPSLHTCFVRHQLSSCCMQKLERMLVGGLQISMSYGCVSIYASLGYICYNYVYIHRLFMLKKQHTASTGTEWKSKNDNKNLIGSGPTLILKGNKTKRSGKKLQRHTHTHSHRRINVWHYYLVELSPLLHIQKIHNLNKNKTAPKAKMKIKIKNKNLK